MPPTLAARLGGAYGIIPAGLVLLVRPAYPDGDSSFLVRLVQGGTDLFGGFTFIGASWESPDPEQVAELFTQFTTCGKPRAMFRAVQPPISPHRSKQ